MLPFVVPMALVRVADYKMSASGPSLDWLNEAAYQQLDGIDRAGIMWEWLRRDARYVNWHRRTVNPRLAQSSDATQWGLHFRRTSGRRGAERAADLVRATRSRRPSCRRNADT